MDKQKNDVVSTEQKWAKYLSFILLVVTLIGGAFLHLRFQGATPRQNIGEKIRLPESAKADEPFCVFVDSLGDHRVSNQPYDWSFDPPQGGHSFPEFIKWSEFEINNVRTPLDELEWTLLGRSSLQVCYPKGLSEGVYRMGFTLNDPPSTLVSPAPILLSYDWLLTVSP